MSFAVNDVSYFVPISPVMVNFKSTSPFQGYLCRASTVIPGSAATAETAAPKSRTNETVIPCILCIPWLKTIFTSFPFPRRFLARWHSWRRKEEWRAFQNPCLNRGIAKRLEETRTEDTPRRIHYVTHLTYPAPSMKIGDFRLKPNTQDCVRCRGPWVGSRGSSFQPCIVPRRIKGFAFGLVKGKELRMENASPTGTCRTGETRRTINQTIRRIYHCPDPHLPLLLNSSNHQSHLSHMSYTSHCSNSGAKHPCPHLSFLHDLHDLHG